MCGGPVLWGPETNTDTSFQVEMRYMWGESGGCEGIERRLFVNLRRVRALREHLTSAPTNRLSRFGNCSKRCTWGAIRVCFVSSIPRVSFVLT